jgi:dTDP-4-amino-4,6-dideoxygalactose transaminase
MNKNKRIYLSSPTMHGLKIKYIQEAFDTNWVAPLGKNMDKWISLVFKFRGRVNYYRRIG